MNRRAWTVIGGVALTGWGVTGALGGCKSAPAPTAPPDDGTLGGTSGGPQTTSGNPPPTGGTSGTITPPADTGPPDTGPPPAVPNPGKISCGPTGAILCDTQTQECCWPQSDAGAGTCTLTGACPDPAGNLTPNFDVTCDEKADCPNPAGDGQLCCFGFGNTLCADDCAADGQGIQICKTNGECVNDAGCALRTCNAGGTILHVRMCGTTPECQ